MKVAAVCARIVGAVIGVLLVPSAVLWLVEVGVAGSWKWLPACLVLVAGLAGCGGAALWWPHKRMRVLAGVTALAWGTLAVSSAYWPAVTTRGEIRSAFDRVDYDDAVVDPTVWELGAAWCTPMDHSVIGCPRLTVDYLVSEGEGDAVVRAIQGAGFRLLGEAEGQPVESFDLPGSGSTGVGSRYWLKNGDIRIEVTVISDQQLAGPVKGLPDVTVYIPSTTERVEVEFTDGANSTRLEIPDELGFWSPDASLDNLQAPVDW